MPDATTMPDTSTSPDATTMPDTTGSPVTAYVIPHTHWDREWYQPFQVFRARLVEVIDQILELLESDPDYRRFTLDGQAIVLEDYLAVRPEKRALIEEQVRAGRLRIGPWYVLADEFLVSPEALVRNLLAGRRVCATFGPSMPVAYTPDSFGHVSQLPLIASGFGLDSIVFERGVGDEGERLRGEFRWLAADGHSEVFAVHLLGTYSAAAALGHLDWQLGDAYDERRAIDQVKAVLFGLDGEAASLPAWLRESFERLPHGILPYCTNAAVILLNGSDHLFPERNLPAIVAQLNDAIPGVRFVHGDLEEFVAAARKPPSELEPYSGEFRGSRYQHLLPGVLSARLYLKRANTAAETLLERFAEPLATLAWLHGSPYPGHLLREAWRLLLQNHPHDSICGCSVDAVHDEMMVRFAGVGQLGEVVASRALQALAGTGDGGVTVFNPLPYARRAVASHTLEVSAGQGGSLVVVDHAGRTVPSQATVARVVAPGRSDLSLERVTLRFLADLPALGVADFRLAEGAPPPGDEGVQAHRDRDGISLDNGVLRLTVSSEGQVGLSDRRGGPAQALHLAFEDSADAGDEYDFSPLAGDATIELTRPSGAPELLETGPVTARVRLSYRLSLPARLSPDRRRREGRSELPLTLDLALDAGASTARASIRLDNRAEDHRLRLRVASGCHSDHVLADGHFDVLKRPVGCPSGAGWFQAPQATSHQRRFVAVSDGQRGLAVLTRGLPEYEATQDADGVTLRITLLRAVGWLSREDLASRPQGAGPSLPTPGAQCPGEHLLELAFMPLRGPWDGGELVEEAQAFQAPPRVQASAGAGAPRSWLALPQPLELTALKRAEDRESVILRILNPSDHAVRGTLELWSAPAEAYLVDLAEERRQALAVASNAIDLAVDPRQVTTLEIVPQPRKGGAAPSNPTWA